MIIHKDSLHKRLQEIVDLYQEHRNIKINLSRMAREIEGWYKKIGYKRGLTSQTIDNYVNGKTPIPGIFLAGFIWYFWAAQDKPWKLLSGHWLLTGMGDIEAKPTVDDFEAWQEWCKEQEGKRARGDS